MLALSASLFAISLLTVFKAPAKIFWYAAIAVTEWGHYMAIGSLLVVLLSWRLTRRWGASSWLALAAAVLYTTPLARALGVAHRLPQDFTAHFQSVSPREDIGAPARAEPLNLWDLFRGIHSPPVQESSHVYATVGGQPLALDLYRPARFDHGLPAVMVIHSGSWQSGDRSEFRDLDRYLAARGYLVVALDYRLAPAAIFPAPRDDVFSAIAYLRSHAAAFGWDQERLVLLGRSAGGQIALSAAYVNRDPCIKGVIAMYTPNDLGWAYAIPANPLIMNSQKVIETYLGGSPDKVPGTYEAASPLRFVNAKTPPTLMIHGVRDELVWALHDERLSKRLTEVGRPYYYLRLPWATHGCDANFSGPCGQLSTYVIERFLTRVMPASSDERLVLLRRD